MTAPTMSNLLVQLADIEARVSTGKATAADIDTAVEAALTAAEVLAGWRGVENQAKRLIEAMMQAGGLDRFATHGGSAVMKSKPVMVHSFDARAIDALCASLPDVAAMLKPHRREHLRAGSLKVVRGAGSANGATTNGHANGAAKAVKA